MPHISSTYIHFAQKWDSGCRQDIHTQFIHLYILLNGIVYIPTVFVSAGPGAGPNGAQK